MTSENTNEYWNTYYAAGDVAREAPSQFAAFVLGEASSHDVVLDVGCGNGRDSFLFGSFGKRVLGLDRSSSAVSRCRATAAAAGLNNVDFAVAEMSSTDLSKRPSEFLKQSSAPLIYARFFIHAITEEDEGRFLSFAKDHLRDGMLALEFRTVRDESLQKVTAGHYRRFVDPIEFTGRARDLGLHATYFVEGFGMAKYKKDDAYVARILLKRTAG